MLKTVKEFRRELNFDGGTTELARDYYSYSPVKRGTKLTVVNGSAIINGDEVSSNRTVHRAEPTCFQPR